MKTIYKYSILSALMLIALSCQQGNDDITFASDGQMSFDVITTRVAGDVFEAEDKIGVYVTDYINSKTPAPLLISGNRANNEVIVYDGSTWTAGRPIYWGTGKSDVYAYYPYMEITDIQEHQFSIATDQSIKGAYEASDLLWAKAEGVSYRDGVVSLAMKHSMSRLVVKIMAGKDYIGSLPKDATVHLHSTVTDVLFSLSDGSVVKDPYKSTHSIKMRNRGVYKFADGEAVVYEAIVVPQMLERPVPLLEINSKSVSYLLEDSFNFKPGTSYTYTVVLNTSTTSIKVEIGCDTDDWNNFGGNPEDGGDEEGGNGDEGEVDDGVDLSLYTDLSVEGTANCYLVSSVGKYKFKTTQGCSDISVGNVKSVDVLWETFGTNVMPNVGDLITTVGYKNGYVYFSTPENFKNGNASIAVRSSNGVILWSWHIWCSEEGWNDDVYANNAGIMMDRNLGATSATPGEVGTLGLLYQWGRKDPFLGSSSTTDDILAVSTGVWSESSEKYSCIDIVPTTFILSDNYIQVNMSDYSWRTSDNGKGWYDPCPAGYRVPDGGENGFWTKAYVEVSRDDVHKGMYWTLGNGSKAWYPSAGFRFNWGNSALEQVGYTGAYWSASYSSNSYCYNLNFTPYDHNNMFQMYVVFGNSVRCVKE